MQSLAHLYMIFVLLLPLAGGLLAYVAGKKHAPKVALVGMIPGLFLSVVLLFEVTNSPLIIRWNWLPGMELGWYVDRISALLLILVYLISLLVHLFSAHYLASDKGLDRYYAKLGFFTFSMLGLLAVDHLMLLFVFWELVGLSSYLLIGFWFMDLEKARSARKAFMINRVADAGLLIGVILMISELNSPFISEFSELPVTPILHLAGFGLLIGALGKSAQFPFFGWLPKAMAGPTPVSALIHAATMVAAGVYLLVRVESVLTPAVLTATAIIGAVTAFMAAVAALSQFDIKKVLAYSTISQLGYMVMGVGVGAYQASLFHLWTHAFFKAGLFLASGAVIHYYHALHHHDHDFDAQDMRNMGGLRKFLPVTHVAFVVCGLALSGLPFFSGFLSKEGILSGALSWASEVGMPGYIVTSLGFITALLTPFYIARQVLLVFYGESRSEVHSLPKMEPAILVKLPLIVLAIGSLWIFNALSPFDGHGWWFGEFLFGHNETTGDHSIQLYTMIISISLVIGGLALAYLRFKPGSRRVLAFKSSDIPNTVFGKLSFNAWFIEPFYEKVSGGYVWLTQRIFDIDRKIIDRLINGFGVSAVVLSKLMAILDREIVDGLVNFVAWISKGIGNLFTKVQAARIQNQLLWMVLLLLVLVLWSQF